MENKDKVNHDELKKKLHELIDSIEDEPRLQALHEDVLAFMISTMDTDEEDDYEEDLTPKQINKREASIKEADEGKTMSHEEFKQSMSRWLID